MSEKLEFSLCSWGNPSFFVQVDAATRAHVALLWHKNSLPIRVVKRHSWGVGDYIEYVFLDGGPVPSEEYEKAILAAPMFNGPPAGWPFRPTP